MSLGRSLPARLDFVCTRISRVGTSPCNAAQYTDNQCPFSKSRYMGELQQVATTRLVEDSSLICKGRMRSCHQHRIWNARLEVLRSSGSLLDNFRSSRQCLQYDRRSLRSRRFRMSIERLCGFPAVWTYTTPVLLLDTRPSGDRRSVPAEYLVETLGESLRVAVEPAVVAGEDDGFLP